MRVRVRGGLVSARWEQITGLLEIKGGERRFGHLNARPTFDAYQPGHTSASLPGDDPKGSHPAAVEGKGLADESQLTGTRRAPEAKAGNESEESHDPFVWGD